MPSLQGRLLLSLPPLKRNSPPSSQLNLQAHLPRSRLPQLASRGRRLLARVPSRHLRRPQQTLQKELWLPFLMQSQVLAPSWVRSVVPSISSLMRCAHLMMKPWSWHIPGIIQSRHDKLIIPGWADTKVCSQGLG